MGILALARSVTALGVLQTALKRISDHVKNTDLGLDLAGHIPIKTCIVQSIKNKFTVQILFTVFFFSSSCYCTYCLTRSHLCSSNLVED